MMAVIRGAVLFLLASCATVQPVYLPELIPVRPVAGTQSRLVQQSCEQHFVQGDWQFVHAITFEMADGHGATVIGVTVLDGEKVKTSLMGVEGFVLFGAEQDKEKKMQVSRALPPFDNLAFAAGLMRDVESIFLLPSGGSPVTGQLADGENVCRYIGEKGRITDVILGEDGSRSINVYDAEGKRSRAIIIENITFVGTRMIAETLQLTAFALRGYTLRMTLISADRI
jgi:hypothetical protein